MGWPWREEYKCGKYHVIARGNNKEYIFKESIDKGYFIKIIKESSEGWTIGYKCLSAVPDTIELSIHLYLDFYFIR